MGVGLESIGGVLYLKTAISCFFFLIYRGFIEFNKSYGLLRKYLQCICEARKCLLLLAVNINLTPRQSTSHNC